MAVSIGYANGIGNFTIFTSTIQSLCYHFNQESIDIFIDSSWINPGRSAIETMIKNTPFTNLKHYPEDFKRENYDNFYMSLHSIFSLPVYREFLGDEVNVDAHPSWASNFLSERDFYYLEIIKQFGYKGPIMEQYVPIDESFKLKEKGLKIAVANGFQRSHYNTFQRKRYNYWKDVMESIKGLYENVTFYLLGGKEDKDWADPLAAEMKCINYAGKLNILQSASVISECNLFMGNDSSAFHMADSLKKPGVVLFSSTLCSKNGPINGTIIPIRSKKACSPCQRTVVFSMCSEPNKCIDSIEPSLVVATIRNILNGVKK